MSSTYLGLLTAAVGVGTSIYGASKAGDAPGGIDQNMLFQMMSARPLGNDSSLGYYSAQNLMELGVPVGVIEQELFQRGLNNAKSPRAARNALRMVNQAQVAARSGNMKKASRILADLNKSAARAGVSISLDAGGDIQYNFQGPERDLINQLREQEANQSTIFGNRMKAIQHASEGLANLQVPNAGDMANLEQQAGADLNSYLDQTRATQVDQINAEANRYGYSPGARIADLDERQGYERDRIARTGAIERAAALSGARTSAASGAIDAIHRGLQPGMSGLTQGAANTSAQTDLSTMQLALQLATMDAQAGAARNAGITNSISGLGGGLTSLGGSLMSSSALAGALGKSGGGGGYGGPGWEG